MKLLLFFFIPPNSLFVWFKLHFPTLHSKETFFLLYFSRLCKNYTYIGLDILMSEKFVPWNIHTQRSGLFIDLCLLLIYWSGGVHTLKICLPLGGPRTWVATNLYLYQQHITRKLFKILIWGRLMHYFEGWHGWFWTTIDYITGHSC